MVPTDKQKHEKQGDRLVDKFTFGPPHSLTQDLVYLRSMFAVLMDLLQSDAHRKVVETLDKYSLQLADVQRYLLLK